MVFVFSLNIHATKNKFEIDEYFHKKHICIEVKSYIGWIRVINEKSRRKFYHIRLSKKEIKIAKLELMHQHIEKHLMSRKTLDNESF